MKLRTLFFLIVLAAVAAFASLNWIIFITPTTLSLGFIEVEAPLGLVMLGMLIFLTALFLVFVVYLQASVLLDARRHAKELQANRVLASQSETSRFTELRGFLDIELKRQAIADAESRMTVLARLDQLERDLCSATEQTSTTISAYIGELEDRLDRGSANLVPRPNS